MIIRVFSPTLHPGKEAEFESFLRDTAIPLVSRQTGLLAQHVGRSLKASSSTYVYVTVWEDAKSIQAFAGEVADAEGGDALPHHKATKIIGQVLAEIDAHPS